MNKTNEELFAKILIEKYTDDLYFVLEDNKLVYVNKNIEIDDLKFDKQKKNYYCKKSNSYYVKSEIDFLCSQKKYLIKKYTSLNSEIDKCVLMAKKKNILDYEIFKNSVIVATKYNRNIVLIAFEIDGFFDEQNIKKIEKEIIRILNKNFRKTDIIGKLNDKCFLIALTTTNLERAKIVLKRFINDIENIEINNKIADIRYSVGVAMYTKGLFENNLKRVLSCLQLSKNNGKNKSTYLEE